MNKIKTWWNARLAKREVTRQDKFFKKLRIEKEKDEKWDQKIKGIIVHLLDGGCEFHEVLLYLNKRLGIYNTGRIRRITVDAGYEDVKKVFCPDCGQEIKGDKKHV